MPKLANTSNWLISVSLAATIAFSSGCGRQSSLKGVGGVSDSGTLQSSLLSGGYRTAVRVKVASASASQAIINPGQVESLQASIVSNVNLSGVIAEIRVVDSNNQMIDYGLVSGVSLAANVPYSFRHSFVSSSSTALGTYTVVVGVWNSTWATTYFYGATGASFQVQAPVSTITPVVTDTAVSVSAPSVSAGQTETISANINSNVNISSAIVSIRVVDANRNIIDSNTFNANLVANQAYAASFNFVPSATLATGTYGIEIGVWSSDWTTTYIYDQPPLTFQVGAAAPVQAAVSVGNTTVSSASISAGQTEAINSSLTSNVNIAGAIVSIRVVDANRNIIDSSTINANLVANQAYAISFNYVPASTVASGTYGIEIGVWSSDWSITYIYDQTPVTFQVGSGTAPAPSPSVTATPSPSPTATASPIPTPSPTGPITYLPAVTSSGNGFTVSGQVNQSSMTVGQIQYGKVRVTSANAMSNLIVTMKYVDSAGTEMINRTLSGANFAAGETKEIDMEYAFKLDMTPGTYSVSVGIFSGDYSTTYFYQRDLPDFQVLSAGYVPPAAVTSMPANNLSMISTADAFLYAGKYFVQNNMWGITGLTAGTYYENSGIGPIASDGSVSARWNWQYPDGPNEVKGYPAVGFGQKPGQPSTPGSGLPRQIPTLNSVPMSWDTQAMYTGRTHLAFDIWLTKDGNRYQCFPCTPITHEVMIDVDSWDYATSNPSWYWGSTIIDGVVYRVWKADNFGGGGITWRFIVLQMVNPIHVTKGSVDFKHVLDYLKAQGLITGQEYLSSVEFGNEMVYGTGDVQIKSFKADVQ